MNKNFWQTTNILIGLFLEVIIEAYISEFKIVSDSSVASFNIVIDAFVNNLLHISNKYFKIIRV